MTKVTIIVPCYNQARFVPKAIASLQAQTLAAWECLVVDDGSMDNTAEVVNNIALNEPRVRLLQKTNSGSASARDMGLKYAQGEYIQFLDADDTIASDKLERQVELMERENLDLSYTAFCTEDSRGQRTVSRAVQLNTYKILVRWGLGASMPIHSFLYRTDFIRRNALTFQSACRFREDWRWHITCFGAHPKQALLPDLCGAIYYQNEQGKTGSYVKMQEGNFEFMAYMTQQLRGIAKVSWALRISEELWIWLLRMVKYRSTEIAKTVVLLPTVWTIIAILLMPISIWWILIYYIKTYISK
ncbi:MAG: glycosyltransferase family 2 protein [Paludibacteraceae bacterium]|nr:glycosyltransferase family 2 protein [Paludibacteraceae bacterium]